MFCNATALLLYGTWYLYSTMNEGYNPWQKCPNTLAYVESTNHTLSGKKNPDSLVDHIPKYSCHNRLYRAAEYHVDGCDIATFQESTETIKRIYSPHHRNHGHIRRKNQQVPTEQPTEKEKSLPFPKKIFFVGDSLIAQLFIATRCALESVQLLEIVEPAYTLDIFLRNDIPCAPTCATNFSSYHNQSSNPLLTPCFNCREDGSARDYERDYLRSADHWLRRLPNDTLALVLGSGAWYNNYKGILQHNVVYRDTLIRLRPLLHFLVHSRKVVVIWLGLPPIEPIYLFDRYDWDSFRVKDAIAAEVLEPVGVQFLNTTHLLGGRKRMDGNVSYDGLHWCNPGTYSAPQFLAQVILHLLAGHTKEVAHTLHAHHIP